MLWTCEEPGYPNRTMTLWLTSSLKTSGVSHLGSAIGVENIQVLMRKLKPTTWEQLQMFSIASGAARQTRLGKCGFIPSITQICLSLLFAIPPICTIQYFAGAVQDCVNKTGGIILWQRSCTAGWREMSLRVIECLATEFAAREQVLMLDMSIIMSIYDFDRSLAGMLPLAKIVDTACEPLAPISFFPFQPPC